MQFHTLVFASFASLIAPFGKSQVPKNRSPSKNPPPISPQPNTTTKTGGFFASGLKRTFKIKDFGDSIPGHGGITDRFDCQFIMGFFTFMYYSSFIATFRTSVGTVIEGAITGLSPEEQLQVVRGLAQYLVNQGVVRRGAVECLNALK